MTFLKARLGEVAQENTVIVVFANYDYLTVLDNWLISLQRLGISNFLVIALDETLYNHLKAMKVSVLLRHCKLGLDNLWIHRVDVIKEILDLGFDLIHSDADAVWLQDPLEEYIYNKPQDMIFSQGTVWPPDVHEIWKFVLCCGFYFVRSNSSTKQFFKQYAQQVRKDKNDMPDIFDDQMSINRMLLNLSIEWGTTDSYSIDFKGKSYQCYKDVITGYSKHLSIALLPHSKFQRLKDSDEDVYVKHLYSDKNSGNILDVLRENNCLFIEDLNRD